MRTTMAFHDKSKKFETVCRVTNSCLSVERFEGTSANSNSAKDSLWSWLVLGVCMLGTMLVGSSYVLFSLLYRDLIEEFNTTSAAVGLVGSLYAGCANLTGIPIGLAIDRYGCRIVCIFGSVVCSIGMFLSFFATHVYVLYATFGLLSGTGLGMIVTTCNVNSMRYFDKKRVLAGGIVSLGYSVGAICVGPIMRCLFQIYSWRGILVLFAGFSMQMIVAAFFAFRPLPTIPDTSFSHIENFPKPNKNESSFRKESFYKLLSDPMIICFLLSCSFMYAGAQSFIHHNPSRALILGIDKDRVNYLPIAFDLMSGVMKVLCGFVANGRSKLGRIILYSVAVIGVGICHAFIFLFKDFPHILLHGALTGFFTGFTFSLYITIIVDLKGLENVTKTQPMTAFCFGIVGLICTPFTGFLYDVTKNYDVTFLVTGLLVIIGGLWGLGTAGLYRTNCSSPRSGYK